MTRRTLLKLAVASVLAPFIPKSHPYSRQSQPYSQRKGKPALASWQEFMAQTQHHPCPSILDDSIEQHYFFADMLKKGRP